MPFTQGSRFVTMVALVLTVLNPTVWGVAVGAEVGTDPRPSGAEILTWHPPSGQPETESGFAPYRDSAGTVIRLSREDFVPFTRFGEPLNPERPWYGAYKRSAKRFPGVRFCLADTAHDQGNPDLAKFDWSKFSSTADAEVCLFRIATSYRTARDFKNWMLGQGFEPKSGYLHRYRPDRNYLGGNDFSVTGKWSVREKGILTENIFMKSFYESSAYGLSIGVLLRPSIGVFETNFSYQIN